MATTTEQNRRSEDVRVTQLVADVDDLKKQMALNTENDLGPAGAGKRCGFARANWTHLIRGIANK